MSDAKDYIVYDSIYMKCPKRHIYRDRKEREQGLTANGYQRNLGSDGNILTGLL